jgi:hypothetical protein
MRFFLVPIAFSLLFFSCQLKKHNCIIDIEVHRPESPAPDIVKYILSIENDELRVILEKGDYIGIFFPQISDRNFNYIFPDRMEIDNDLYIFYLETSKFRINKNDLDKQVEVFKSEAEILIKREGGNIVLTNCI